MEITYLIIIVTQRKIYSFIYFITVDLPAAYLSIYFLPAVVPVLIYLYSFPGGLANPYFSSFPFLILLIPGEVTYLFICLERFAHLIFHFHILIGNIFGMEYLNKLDRAPLLACQRTGLVIRLERRGVSPNRGHRGTPLAGHFFERHP